MEIIKVENLSFAYQASRKHVLENISFSVDKGDLVILYGLSGSGKSTLLKLMKKEISPIGNMRGNIYYGGKEISMLSDRISASEIGYVMQNPDEQIVTDKVYRELAFGLENLGAPNDIIRLRVAEISSLFGINKWFYSNTANLSGGQKQLLNLASVMTLSPNLLLLDEPVSQLDPFSAATFMDMLIRINREHGVTVIIAEHNLENIFAYADNIAVLDETRLKYFGVPRTCSDYFAKEAAIIEGMPVPARIYRRFEVEDAACPVNVREARLFLHRHCPNIIRHIDKKINFNKNPVAVRLSEVYFRYKRNSPDIVKSLNLAVKRGEIYAIVGGNGSGKTTLLSIISGQIKPYSGKVFINGVKLNSSSKIAVIPQNPRVLFTGDTLRSDLIHFAVSTGVPEDVAASAVYDLCRILGIMDILKNHPFDLSGGEIQKAAIAKVMISSPDVILLDEPTKGVDAWSKKAIAEILRRLTKNGKAIIIVTHDNEFAAETADTCGLLFDGTIVSEAPSNIFYSQNDFYTTSAARITRGFFENATTYEDIIKLCKENGGVK
ncbi:MAG: ATP-binding cassette domain-containing protein [Clostridium sp.]|nr:ATP-binding cassette domain-containing protein [Clostridium sp.]MCM1547321.1 ATP-binding cassette domain-containing protein [Ruminococcus sp.]